METMEDIYGHRYDVYYYKYRVGLLQVSASPNTCGMFSENIQNVDCKVHVDVALDLFSSVFISFDEIVEFLKRLARMLSDVLRGANTPITDMTERRYVEKRIERALTRSVELRRTEKGQNPKRTVFGDMV